jgi:serine/threonine protein kinase/CheY-like chemotaxis protein
MDGAILIVDDTKANRDMLARRLARLGYATLTAESGPEALLLLAEKPVSLLLLDLMMPDMSGIEVLQEVRKSRDDRDLPVLMVSANTESPQMVEAINQGANDYLTKPSDFPVLAAKVRRYLGQGSGRSTSAAAAPAAAATHVSTPAPAAPSAAVPLKTPAPARGEMLNHYRLGDLLGKGGMGEVYRAHDTRLERDIALKLIVADAVKPDALARFLREARAVARVSHPGVVTIFEVATEPRHYIAMELVRGRPLQEVTAGQPLPVPRALALMEQVLEALQEVHQAGVVHRDLKPANIMVLENDRVKVLDFGLAKLDDDDQQLTKSGTVWGTPQYMTPEQLEPEFGKIDAHTDQFAAASVFYEMVTGRPAFAGPSMRSVTYQIVARDPLPAHEAHPDVGPELSAILDRALQKEKGRRFESCRDFREALLSLRATY